MTLVLYYGNSYSQIYDKGYKDYNYFTFTYLQNQLPPELNLTFKTVTDLGNDWYLSKSLGFIEGFATKPASAIISTIINPNITSYNDSNKFFSQNNLETELSLQNSDFTPITGVNEIHFKYIPSTIFNNLETKITGHVGTSLKSSFTNILNNNNPLTNNIIFNELTFNVVNDDISDFPYPISSFNINFKTEDTDENSPYINNISFNISTDTIPSAATGTASIPVQLYNTINNNLIKLTENPIIYQFDYEFNLNDDPSIVFDLNDEEVAEVATIKRIYI